MIVEPIKSLTIQTHHIMTTHYPFSNRIFGDLNRLIHNSFGPAYAESQAHSNRALDHRTSLEALSDDEQGIKLRLELPGFTKDEVKLSVDDGVLHVVAETEDEERSFLTSKERRFKVTDEADVENIKAKLENGILYLEIPHRAKAEPKRITVN